MNLILGFSICGFVILRDIATACLTLRYDKGKRSVFKSVIMILSWFALQINELF